MYVGLSERDQRKERQRRSAARPRGPLRAPTPVSTGVSGIDGVTSDGNGCGDGT